MLEVMFKIPSIQGVKRVIINEATIENGTMPVLEGGDGAVLKIA